MSMILLKGHSLTIKNHFTPESMSLSLEERTSSASMTMGPDAPEISVGDWVKDETEPGKGIVWRVKTVDEAVETRTRTVQLEHVVQSLKDRVLFGEVKPGTITGNANDKSCSARQAAAYAIARQDDWKLGDTPVNPTNPYSFNGENIYAALEMISSSMADVQWEYDLSAHPFTLHIRKQPASGFTGEMRMSRNITTMRRQIDRSRMYTRIYPIGKDNLHIGGEYLSKNEGTWGIVCKVETDQTKEDEAQLRSWAQEKLNRHCEPLVTITITGLDLSRATGEALDKITLGKRCRVPLPDKGITITERVTKLQWSDKIKKPDEFTVTMANNTEDIASIVNRIQEEVSSGRGGGGRYGASKNEEDHAWFVDTNEHVGMVAEAVAGPGADQDWSRVASIFVDGEGIHQKVTRAEKEIVTAETRIEANEDAIRLEAEKRIKEDQSLLGKIQVEAGKVAMVVGTNSGGNFIKAAQICVAINKDGSSSAVIEASKIHLLGETIAQKVTADYVKSRIAELAVVSVKSMVCTRNIQAGGAIYAGSFHIGTADGSKNVAYALLGGKIKQSGNTYTLVMNDFTGREITIGTFSRAVASWDQSWSGGNFTAKAQPQGQSCWTAIAKGTASWNGRTVTIPIVAYNSNSPGTAVSTGYSVSETYSLAKNDITMSRGSRQTSQPSADAAFGDLTQNGYYVYTVTVHGVSKTYRQRINVTA